MIINIILYLFFVAVRSYAAPAVPVNRLLYKVTASDGDGDQLIYSYKIDPPLASSFIKINPGIFYIQ